MNSFEKGTASPAEQSGELEALEAQLAEATQAEKYQREMWEKNNERAFEMQSHVDVDNPQQVRALETLRSLRDHAAINLETAKQKRAEIENQISILKNRN